MKASSCVLKEAYFYAGEMEQDKNADSFVMKEVRTSKKFKECGFTQFIYSGEKAFPKPGNARKGICRLPARPDLSLILQLAASQIRSRAHSSSIQPSWLATMEVRYFGMPSSLIGVVSLGGSCSCARPEPNDGGLMTSLSSVSNNWRAEGRVYNWGRSKTILFSRASILQYQLSYHGLAPFAGTRGFDQILPATATS